MLAINCAESCADRRIDHNFPRIDVRAQIVTRNAGVSLDLKHMLGRQLLRLIDPAGDAGLRNTKRFSHCILRPVNPEGLHQGFEAGHAFHALVNIR